MEEAAMAAVVKVAEMEEEEETAKEVWRDVVSLELEA